MYPYVDPLASLPPLPSLVALGATVVLVYLVYRRHQKKARRWTAWSAVCASVAVYGFAAALAPGGWDEPLVLLGALFASLAGYAWLDRGERPPPSKGAKTVGGGGWFG